MAGQDHWARWLLERRFGGDAQQLERTLQHLRPIRDRVIAAADIKDGDVLLDVGTGDGLIGFAALDRVGPAGRVIFSDVSQDLIARCRELAATFDDSASRCQFVVAEADDLSAIADASVDVVTTRSVLIYVQNKRRALTEFHRVLRPGGRVSIFEPINKFDLDNRRPADFAGYDLSAIPELVTKVNAAYQAAGPPLSESPMFNFDERDLLEDVRGAGFRFVRLEYEAVIEPTPPMGGPIPWDTFYRSSGNPNEPTVGEVVSTALAANEADAFEHHLRPLVESGVGIGRSAVAYLTAEA
jgi:ubiquinone/menaquinone biosynthesis C-methylase UbiE